MYLRSFSLLMFPLGCSVGLEQNCCIIECSLTKNESSNITFSYLFVERERRRHAPTTLSSCTKTKEKNKHVLLIDLNDVVLFAQSSYDQLLGFSPKNSKHRILFGKEEERTTNLCASYPTCAYISMYKKKKGKRLSLSPSAKIGQSE